MTTKKTLIPKRMRSKYTPAFFADGISKLGDVALATNMSALKLPIESITNLIVSAGPDVSFPQG